MILREERERGERLRAYFDAAKDRAGEWGVDDCSTWPLRWVLDEARRECDWPVYSTKEEADAIVSRAGGLVPLWTDTLNQVGLHECYAEILPVGSVAVVNLDRAGSRQVGCILAFANVACFRTETGTRAWSPRRNTIAKAWALP